MKEIIRLCSVLTIIAAVSAGVLAFVSQKTAEPIANALLEEKMAAIRNVLPAFDNDPYVDRRTVTSSTGEEVEIYPGLSGGSLVGVAFEVVAPDGYSGDINFMVGVNMDGIVQGIEILLHLETPGLGAKIVEEGFREQYRGKSLSEPEEWAVTKDGGTFIPITGATISSRAITNATAKGLGFFRDNIKAISGQDSAASPAEGTQAQQSPGHSVEGANGSEEEGNTDDGGEE